MEYLLLVTWFLGGNSTTSYQVAFATRQACEIALSELRNDARRLGAFGRYGAYPGRRADGRRDGQKRRLARAGPVGRLRQSALRRSEAS
jgi:hypothetical protein